MTEDQMASLKMHLAVVEIFELTEPRLAFFNAILETSKPQQVEEPL